MIPTITLIQQRILYFNEFDEMKLADFKDPIKKLKRFVNQFAIENNAKNAEMEMT